MELELEQKIIEEFIKITKRKAVYIEIDSEKKPTITCSKFGGVPYWDMQMEYPKNEKGYKLMLLAQINFDELSKKGINPDNQLPQKGMLQFFIDVSENDCLYGVDFDMDERQPDGKLKQDGYRVVYHKDINYNVSKEEIESLGIPVSTNLSDDEDSPIFIETAVNLSLKEVSANIYEFNSKSALIKAARNMGVDIEENTDVYDILQMLSEKSKNELYDLSNQNEGYWMLGSALFTQEDPRNYKEELQDYDVQLLQMDSDLKNEGILWGDSGIANFFIKKEDLAKQDFSDVLYTWDCC